MSAGGRPLTNRSYSDAMRRATGTHEAAEESRRSRKGGLRLPGCCFLAPAARPPGREHRVMDDGGRSSKQQHHPERTTEQPPPPTNKASRCSISDSNGSSNRSRGAEQPRSRSETTRTPTEPSKTTGAGGGVAGAFGPVVGLSVVVAVSMAGLLGGRLCAVACLCAWLAALSKLRRREAAATTTAGSELVVVDVDCQKEPVVLRGLLERDRRKAVAAA